MDEKNDAQIKISTRDRILEAASRLFTERGYAATSVRDIAAEIGIANPSLYYHFKSKSEILIELLSEPLRRVEVTVKETEALTGEARTRRIINGLLESLEVYSGITVTAFQESGQISEIYELVTSRQAQVAELLALDAATDNRQIRVTMAIAGVQGIVQELIRTSSDADDFVKQLQDKREFITELVLKILR